MSLRSAWRLFAAKVASRSSRRGFAFSAGAAAGTLLPTHLLPSVAPSLAPLLLALVLLHTADQASKDVGETEPLPLSAKVPYRVAKVEGAGLGAIASRDIERGEVIITDAPLLIWPQGISNEEAEELESQLTNEARGRFRALSNAQPPSRGLNDVLGKRATNAFAVQVPKLPDEVRSDSEHAAAPESLSFLYPNIARINHSCRPNADHAIDWSTLRMSVYASSSIDQGQEICIEYMPMLLLPRQERRDVLQQTFGFDCTCASCGAPEHDVARSDERRMQIAKMVDRIAELGSKGTVESRQAVIQGFERIRTLLEEENYRALPDLGHEQVARAYVLYIANRAQFQVQSDARRQV